jgi:hypothetical protein
MLFLELTKQVKAGFALPIFQSDMEDMDSLNQELSEFLLKERVGAKAEELFDWRTMDSIRSNPSVESVVGMFGSAITHLCRLQVNMEVPASDINISADVWGTVTRGGAVKSMLNYSPLHWRGIYFLRCDTRVTIELAPPHLPVLLHGAGKYGRHMSKIVLEPTASTAIVFPAQLTHSILYGPGDGLNIALEVTGGVLLTEKEAAT